MAQTPPPSDQPAATPAPAPGTAPAPAPGTAPAPAPGTAPAPGYAPAAPAAPVKKKKGCLGCGCGGCLLSIVLILALVAAGIYFFAILPASAGSDTPATLSVFVASTQVGKSQNGDYSGGTTGQSLAPG